MVLPGPGLGGDEAVGIDATGVAAGVTIVARGATYPVRGDRDRLSSRMRSLSGRTGSFVASERSPSGLRTIGSRRRGDRLPRVARLGDPSDDDCGGSCNATADEPDSDPEAMTWEVIAPATKTGEPTADLLD